jgi:hypothetical protein
VFGDFEIAAPPAEEPAPVLGTACEPGAYRCTNELLEICNDDRSDFKVAEVCASAAECDVYARACRPCVPGERMCRGNVLERCDDSSLWVMESTCDTPELCTVASDRMSGSCAAATCEAGRHGCEGAVLVRCTEGRNDWQDVALCENPELCDPEYADTLAQSGTRGACRPAACEPGAFLCEGAELKQCAIDRTSFLVRETCESAELCNVMLGACVACEPGVIACNGAELRRCTPAGAWEVLDRCASAALCDLETESCLEPDCTAPGTLHCGGGRLLEVCSDDLTWAPVAACATSALCNATSARCLTPACEEGEVRCVGDRHEGCSADRSRWELLATCPAGSRCEPDQGCVPGPCAEETARCNGPSLERCTGGVFEEVQRCETEALCDAPNNTCKMHACTEPYACNETGSIIRKCRPGRDALDEYLTCQSGTTCDARPALGTGQPECDACVANSYECNGNELTRCSSDGKRRERVATCTVPCNATSVPPTCI